MAKYISKAKRIENYATGYVPKAPNSVLLDEHNRDLDLQLNIDQIEVPIELPDPPPSEPDIPLSDISVDRLLDTGLVILMREMKNLMSLSSNGKLEANDARDLRDTVKLLFELKEREAKSLASLSDEELASRAKAALDDGQ